jgi:hypothetical protein
VTEHDQRPTPRGPVPDLGFFAATGQPPPARPNPPMLPSAAGPPAPPPVPAPTPLPAPPPFTAPAPPFPAAPHAGNVPPGPLPYLHPYAAPARGGLPGWAIALICTAGGGLLIMIVAAVAIPVFLHERDTAVARATTLSPAAQVAGMTRSTDPRLQQMTDQMSAGLPACGCFRPAVTATYQDPDRTRVLVVIGAMFTGPVDREGYLRGFWHGAHSSMPTLGPESGRDPGRLGGTLSCAALSTGGAYGQLCVSMDAGALVILVDLAKVDHHLDPALMVTARESMEHRT